MAWVVNVTWALARFGGVLRLRADFVVTEAMVVFTGWQSVLLLREQGGRAALAGQPRGGRRALAGDASSRGGPEEVGRRAPGVGHSARVCQAC